MGFDFGGKIGNKVGAVVDTDFMDIYRGGISDIPGRQLLYSNIPCHVSLQTSDSPDPGAVDLAPIITSLRIHMNNDVDIQNDDYIVAKKATSGNQLLIAYSGLCGHPAASQARKYVSMTMNAATDPRTPGEPLPPKDPAEINIRYADEDGANIAAPMTTFVDRFSPVTIQPRYIEHYRHIETFLDGERLHSADVFLASPDANYSIVFVYRLMDELAFFRALRDGPFTTTSGGFSFGWHLFGVIRVFGVKPVGGGAYEVEVENIIVPHQDMGALTLEKDTIIKGFAAEEWFIIDTSPAETSGGYSFEIAPYIPSDAQKNAPITRWYD